MVLNYDDVLSENGKVSLPDGIRGLFPLEKPHVVSFLAGKPNPQTFPFESMTLHLKPPLETAGVSLTNGAHAAGLSVDGVKPEADGGVTLELDGDDMNEALQYGPTAGLTRLVQFLTKFTSEIHGCAIPAKLAPPIMPAVPRSASTANSASASQSPSAATSGQATPALKPSETIDSGAGDTGVGEVLVGASAKAMARVGVVDNGKPANGVNGTEAESKEVPWRVTVGNGCQDLLNKAFQTLLNPGDPILVETPVYAGVVSQFTMHNMKMIEVEVDSQGLSAVALKETLESWPAGQKRPHVLYTVPVGSNPTGCSSSVERKLEVLQICKEYGIIIIEDDPYYFLATELIPSYFALETRVIPEGGHVIRFDSFSKLLSAGMRLGFAAGPKRIMDAMDNNTSAANLQPNSLAMAVAYRLLRYWGIRGFKEHGHRVAAFYAARRDQFEAIAHRHLDGIATWNSPVAGMFLWIDVSPLEDTYELVMNEALDKGVLAVPGFAFYCVPRKSQHLRVSFSLIDMERAEVGFQALADAIREKRKALGIDA